MQATLCFSPHEYIHEYTVLHLAAILIFTRYMQALLLTVLISTLCFSRFSRLRSLNLSNNHLGQFPLAICDISTLTEVNLSCNYLDSVPSSVGAMSK